MRAGPRLHGSTNQMSAKISGETQGRLAVIWAGSLAPPLFVQQHIHTRQANTLKVDSASAHPRFTR